MMNYQCLHEVETVSFPSLEERDLASVLPCFLELGFTLHDDVVSLDRKEPIPPWQQRSIVSVEFQYKGEEVFGFDEGLWDCVHLRYLFAWLPFELARVYAEIVDKIAHKLEIAPIYRGATTRSSDLLQAFQQNREELYREVAEEPGSESLAILIQNTYPRR